jgi:subtilisin family serine protease
MIFLVSSSVIQSIIILAAAAVVVVSSSSATNITALAPTAAAVVEYDTFANAVVVANNNTKYLVFLKDEEGVDPEEKCASLANSTGVVVDQVYKYSKICVMTLPLPAEAAATLATLKNDPSVENIEAYDEEDEEEFVYDYSEEEEEDEESNNIFMMGGKSEKPNRWGRNRINQCELPLDNSFAKKQDATGVKVFIVDGGIYSDHTEFEGIMVQMNAILTHTLRLNRNANMGKK